MRQLSLLFDDYAALAGLMPAVRAAMRRAAGEPESEGRKLLVDKINHIARQAEIKLTSGNTRIISKDTLDKWLSPSDTGHPPSITALIVFCRATGDSGPLRVLLRAIGADIMTEEDRVYAEIGRQSVEAKKKNAEAKKARRAIQELEERL